MKKFLLTIAIFSLALISVKTNTAFATVDDFYFKSATFDYYLEKTSSGSSNLRVKEVLTAVFPDYDQNHGIIRCLPQSSFGDSASLDDSTFSVSQNGEYVPYSLSPKLTETCLQIGDETEYVHGATEYSIEYEYNNVIINPYDSDKQELYWDTNGNGWSQKFNSLTATVHLSGELAEATKSFEPSCYIGTYGARGEEAQKRCKISSSSDGQTITFESIALNSDYSSSGATEERFSGLNENETLTFDIQFASNTFVTDDENSETTYSFSRTDTNDFYFSEGIFDYYLEKRENETSSMRVVEQLTAQLPDFDRNHGITRCIPKKYNGTSIFTDKKFEVLRNGVEEPFSTYTEDGMLCLRIGSADSYVKNKQIYQITYNLENVILQPNNSENQELYWDINGNGWSQQFNNIIARIHLPESLNSARISQLESDLSCYTGRYGVSNQSYCTITTESSEESHYPIVLRFVTTNSIKSQETLTINIPFKNGTFAVKGPDPNYFLYAIIVLVTIITIILLIALKKANDKVKDKKAIAKNKITPVQYIPPNGITVAEAGEIWLKSPRSSQVATLMELAVAHKIELEKGEKKTFGGYNWKIHIKTLDGNTAHQNTVLKILNGGSLPGVGEVIEVKRRSATSELIKLGNNFPKEIQDRLKKAKLLEENKKSNSSAVIAIIIFLAMFFGTPLIAVLFETLGEMDESGVAIVALVVYAFAAFIIFPIAFSNIAKYKERTIEGINTSKYLDGLKKYMSLAEKDRIAFLQSVEGADTTHNGIARLYERLLPYAVLFGMEDSWFKELNKYYEMDDVNSGDWITGAAILSASDFRSFSSYTSSSISGSTASSDSGGSSGGGGGGFSGGGGGGGGGGGW